MVTKEVARNPKLVVDRLVVELAALLHDVKDWKYSKSHKLGPAAVLDFLTGIGKVRASAYRLVNRFAVTKCLTKQQIDRIVAIVGSIGFKSELPSQETKESLVDQKTDTTDMERDLVRDADRLDAMGAIGIARAFVYGGSRGASIYDASRPPRDKLTREDYMSASDVRPPPTWNHFHEKLLKLEPLMRTASGKKLAQERHAWMQVFVVHLEREI